MSIDRVLSNDGMVKETFHIDNDGIATIAKKSDATKILKANKFQRDHQTERFQSETMNHVARIDVTAVEAWCKVRGIKYGDFLAEPDHVKSFLNDPDNAFWRTRKGKI